MKYYLIKSQIESLKKESKELRRTLNLYTKFNKIYDSAKIQLIDEILQIETMINALKKL